jgi:SAM-dependent methyltransferase
VTGESFEDRRDYWDLTAETYDQIFPDTLVGQTQREAVWRQLARVFHRGQRVLEMNCGTGIDAVHLAAGGIQVLACDLSPRMIELATRRSVAANTSRLIEFRVLPTEQIGHLAEEGPFDGALSNFSGLNCVADLSSVARGLGRLLRPRANLLVCMAGKIAPWEMAWYFGHGDVRAALRRLRSTAEDPRVSVFFPTVRRIQEAFAPGFRMLGWRGIGIAVPPSCMEPVARRLPAIVKLLASADQFLGPCPLFRALADCVLLHFERAAT